MSQRIKDTDVLWLAILPASVLGLGALATAAVVWTRRERRRIHSLATNLSHVLHHLHSYALANDENFPDRIGKLVDEGHIPWLPNNPYTGGPMQEVTATSRKIAGGFSYLPWREKSSGEIIAATLVGYRRSPRLRRLEQPPLPLMPDNLPWSYSQFVQTTGFLPQSPDDLELVY